MNARKVSNAYASEQKKMGRIPEACYKYSLGENSMRKVAAEAGAIVRIGRAVLVNYDVLDNYLARIAE